MSLKTKGKMHHVISVISIKVVEMLVYIFLFFHREIQKSILGIMTKMGMKANIICTHSKNKILAQMIGNYPFLPFDLLLKRVSKTQLVS